MNKGQASVEFLIIFAVALIALIAIVSYTNDSTAQFNNKQLVDQGQQSVDVLALAANDVYRQGVGAKKKVYYVVPSGTDESKSGIEQSSFVLNVLNSDVYGRTNVTLSGTLPVTAGGHYIWFTAHENYVFVGTQDISVNKTSVYTTLGQSDSSQETVIITNNGTDNATINISSIWTAPDVNVNYDITNFVLAPAVSQIVTITFSSNGSAAGNYPGTMKINANFPAKDENILIPLNAQIITGGGTGNLTIFPSSRMISLKATESDSNSFQTCNNGSEDINDINFTISGTASSWITGIIPNPITNLTSGNCQGVTYTANVPSGQTVGFYSATITGTDSMGAGSNIDTMVVNINVTASPTNSDCFVFDWSTAVFAGGGRNLQNWQIQNTCSSAIIIGRMRVRELSVNDLDGALLNGIRLNNISVWTGSQADANVWINITDFTIPANTTYGNNDKLEFSQRVDDDSEDFYIVFEFTDLSLFTTPIYSP